ncbi:MULTISPECIES: hypothetical protein [unclassified Novosphingobium]|uniref:hypothetical protein n=1 Tax=unclassified Novosphingobium TaxID=2644732 RepID=UPI0013587DA6|nr:MULTISPECIES: hypothetical protein [unclassified Novosphingobium]
MDICKITHPRRKLVERGISETRASTSAVEGRCSLSLVIAWPTASVSPLSTKRLVVGKTRADDSLLPLAGSVMIPPLTIDQQRDGAAPGRHIQHRV